MKISIILILIVGLLFGCEFNEPLNLTFNRQEIEGSIFLVISNKEKYDIKNATIKIDSYYSLQVDSIPKEEGLILAVYSFKNKNGEHYITSKRPEMVEVYANNDKGQKAECTGIFND